MSEHPPGSLGFFRDHVPETGDALVGLIDTLYDECALDPKSRELVFLGIQAALRLPRRDSGPRPAGARRRRDRR